MKFSVLLPTRNRLEYLRYAVETVRRQDYTNWEVIISDNFSEDDISGYVRSLADPRIKYFRTAAPVPVTDNWNNALRHSIGDYVVMLGDDDGLMPFYFSSLLKAFETHPGADFVYLNAYFFAYQGAVKAEPMGFLRRDRSPIFSQERLYWLDVARARQVARSYLNFRMPVASNMQFSLISRRVLNRLSGQGQFFRSPFPDFYATPLLFLRSHRILVYSTPLVIVGITPKSYGAFHFSSRTAEGVNLLANEKPLAITLGVRNRMLPGTSYYDSWLLAMEALQDNSDGTSAISPNYRRYRFLQIVHCFKGRYFDHKRSPFEIRELRSKMTLFERMIYGLTFPVFFWLLRLVSDDPRGRILTAMRQLIGQHSIEEARGPATRHYQNLLDVYESFEHAPASARYPF